MSSSFSLLGLLIDSETHFPLLYISPLFLNLAVVFQFHEQKDCFLLHLNNFLHNDLYVINKLQHIKI